MIFCYRLKPICSLSDAIVYHCSSRNRGQFKKLWNGKKIRKSSESRVSRVSCKIWKLAFFHLRSSCFPSSIIYNFTPPLSISVLLWPMFDTKKLFSLPEWPSSKSNLFSSHPTENPMTKAGFGARERVKRKKRSEKIQFPIWQFHILPITIVILFASVDEAVSAALRRCFLSLTIYIPFQLKLLNIPAVDRVEFGDFHDPFVK